MRCEIGARKKNACNRLEDGVYLVTLVNPDRLFLKFDARLVFEIRVLHACLHRPMHVERLVLADNSSASAIDATKLENISHSVVSGGRDKILTATSFSMSHPGAGCARGRV